MTKKISQAEKNWSAISMTLGITAVAVPINVLFGVAAAWAITKFRFKGRSLLVSLIDLPFSVSPVVSGLVFVLLMGRQGFLRSGAGATASPWLVAAVRGAAPTALAAWLAFGLVTFVVLGGRPPEQTTTRLAPAGRPQDPTGPARVRRAGRAVVLSSPSPPPRAGTLALAGACRAGGTGSAQSPYMARLRRRARCGRSGGELAWTA